MRAQLSHLCLSVAISLSLLSSSISRLPLGRSYLYLSCLSSLSLPAPLFPQGDFICLHLRLSCFRRVTCLYSERSLVVLFLLALLLVFLSHVRDCRSKQKRSCWTVGCFSPPPHPFSFTSPFLFSDLTLSFLPFPPPAVLPQCLVPLIASGTHFRQATRGEVAPSLRDLLARVCGVPLARKVQAGLPLSRLLWGLSVGFLGATRCWRGGGPGGGGEGEGGGSRGLRATAGGGRPGQMGEMHGEGEGEGSGGERGRSYPGSAERHRISGTPGGSRRPRRQRAAPSSRGVTWLIPRLRSWSSGVGVREGAGDCTPARACERKRSCAAPLLALRRGDGMCMARCVEAARRLASLPSAASAHVTKRESCSPMPSELCGGRGAGRGPLSCTAHDTRSCKPCVERREVCARERERGVGWGVMYVTWASCTLFVSGD